MVRKDPSQRPSAFEALREWKAIRKQVSGIQRYWRLRPPSHEESWIATLWFEFKASVSPSPTLVLLGAFSNGVVRRSLLSLDPGDLRIDWLVPYG